MGVYIDRDELLELYANTDDLDLSNYYVKVAVIRQNILDMPTIDLVRCGECKWYLSDVNENGDLFSVCTGQNYGWTRPSDFCSHGERKINEIDLLALLKDIKISLTERRTDDEDALGR